VSDLTATGALARFAVHADALPEHAAVVTALVDTVGVAVAGTGTDASALLTAWADTEPTTGPAAVWGRGTFRAPAQAALLNGTAAHALDWDDASPSMAMHPSAVLFPALLAQAAVTRADGATLVAAYGVGAAAFRAVSQTFPLAEHNRRGWHNTATTGRIAACAALARLTGLDEMRTRQALGIVASMASGSTANFGTMTKPLHAGLAARDAVTAVGLACRGFTANTHQLDAGGGFFAQFGTGAAELTAGLGDRLDHWATEWPADTAVKRYPSCYGTHRAIDATLAARAGLLADGDLDTVTDVHVRVRPGSLRPLIDHVPGTGLEGKFSLEYTVAVALLHGDVGLDDFTDDAVHRPAVRTLMHRVRGEEAPAVAEMPGAEVRVTAGAGPSVTARADVARGDASNPLSPEETEDKFAGALAGVGIGRAAARAFAGRLVAGVDDTDLTPLQQLLAHPAL
jgi:2-methylcitrate dehydratase PrpD